MELSASWIYLWNRFEKGSSQCSKYIQKLYVFNFSPNLFVSCEQCRQLTGLLDVGYTRMIEGVVTVVHRRNVTIKTGCFCMPVNMQRVQQIESNIGHAQVHMHNISGP